MSGSIIERLEARIAALTNPDTPFADLLYAREEAILAAEAMAAQLDVESPPDSESPTSSSPNAGTTMPN